MKDIKMCNTCARPMVPEYKYKPHQSQCWDCWGRENRKNQTVEGGHVYIAEYFNMYTQRTYKKMYKVGMTQRDNAQKRVAEIGDTLGPMKVRLVRHWATDDARALETALHQKLKPRKIEGEWFDIEKNELINLIEETVYERSEQTL